jgi:hypothetical protein
MIVQEGEIGIGKPKAQRMQERGGKNRLSRVSRNRTPALQVVTLGSGEFEAHNLTDAGADGLISVFLVLFFRFLGLKQPCVTVRKSQAGNQMTFGMPQGFCLRAFSFAHLA